MPKTEEWLTSTPRMEEYQLHMEHQNEFIQTIDLSREEYIKLKMFLAQLRGATLPPRSERECLYEVPIWEEVEPAELESFGLIQSGATAA